MKPTLKEALSINIEKRIKQMLESNNFEYALRQQAQSVIYRKYEYGFYENVYKSLYNNCNLLDKKPFVNIGPGSFRHPYWTNIDRRYNGEGWTQVRRFVNDNKPDIEWDFFSHEPLAVENDTYYLAYCSHVIEHGFNDDIEFLLGEIHRILKHNGMIRIVCPDAEIFKNIYESKNWFIFYNYLCVKAHRLHYKHIFMNDYDLQLNSLYFILDMFSLLRNKKNPIYLNNKDTIRFFNENSFYRCLDIASNLSSRELNNEISAHVNWFNYDKLSYFLQKAGFRSIRKVGYLQSNHPVFSDGLLFDKTDKEFSLFVEAYA